MNGAGVHIYVHIHTCKPQELKTLDNLTGFYQIYLDNSIPSGYVILKTFGCKNRLLEYQVRMEKC